MDYEKTTYTQWDGTSFERASGDFIAEAPLMIDIKDAGSVVILRTPGLESAHAAGFLLSAGYIETAEDIVAMEPSPTDNNYILLILTKVCTKKAAFLMSQPKIAGEDVQRPKMPMTGSISAFQAFSCLEAHLTADRPLRTQTHSAHGSTIFDRALQPLCFAEDVGRHNALDKAVGQLLITGKLKNAYLLALSSRMSLDLIQKAAAANIELVLAKARPTTAAVALAKKLNITVACMRKDGGLLIFSAPERLLP